MDISVILQVITIAITSVTLFTDYLYNLKINRRTRTFGLIGQEMIDKLDNFRNAYAKLLELTDIKGIDEYVMDNKVGRRFNSTYAYNLNVARSQVKTNTLPFWDREKHMHQQMDKLCLSYYERKKVSLIEEINSIRDDFLLNVQFMIKLLGNSIKNIFQVKGLKKKN